MVKERGERRVERGELREERGELMGRKVCVKKLMGDGYNIKKALRYYTGLLIIIAVLLLMRVWNADMFALLNSGLILIFGYVAAVIDYMTKRIPNKLVLVMLAVWAVIASLMLFFDTDAALGYLMDSAIGFLVGGGMFLLVYIISRKGLGGGDVKFMAAAGLYLGLGGTVMTILCGTILAALVGLTLMMIKKINKKDKIPLAPFLYAGILITTFLVLR